MREKLKKMMWGETTGEYIPNTIAEYAIMRNIFETMPEISIAEPVCFDGISNGKRNTEKQASLYDARLAEMIDDRNAEKARVRNRRRADRKHKLTPKMRKEQELMRKDRMYGYAWNLDCPKVRFAPDSEPIKIRKYSEGDRINRDDWEKDLSALKYDISYAEFDVETSREDIRDFNMEIQHIEYELSNMEILRERLERLRKSRDDAEGYLRNSEEFLRKYNYVKEMI